jgi:hypothetical protein
MKIIIVLHLKEVASAKILINLTTPPNDPTVILDD